MTDRCRCSHIKATHYTNRWGRGMCQYPCGCDTFRPEPADRPHPGQAQVSDQYDPDPTARPWGVDPEDGP